METMRAGFAACAILALSGCGEQPVFTSATTSIDLETCDRVGEEVAFDGATWQCESFGDIPVYVSEGDLRAYVSFEAPESDRAARTIATQTLTPYNRLGNKLEWRLATRENETWPVAVIARYTTQVDHGDNEFDEGEVLVVAKYAPDEACHMAYVDVPANPNAETLARAAADEEAIDFDCADDEIMILGAPGVSLADTGF